MLHTLHTSSSPLRSIVLTLALWMGGAFVAQATDETRIRDNAIEVDVRENFTVHFSQTNVVESGEVISGIMGVSSQFRGGQMILGEVLFKTPMALSEFQAITQANNSSAMAFECARAGLFQIEGREVISGEGCVVVTGDETHERKN